MKSQILTAKLIKIVVTEELTSRNIKLYKEAIDLDDLGNFSKNRIAKKIGRKGQVFGCQRFYFCVCWEYALNSIVEEDIKSLATKLTKDNLVEVIMRGKR